MPLSVHRPRPVDEPHGTAHTRGAMRSTQQHSRRRFLQGSLAVTSLGLLASCGLPLAPSAQLYRVGTLQPFGPTATGAATLEALRQGLRDFGYIEGQNVLLEVRYSEGRDERLPELAAELVRWPADV